MNIRLLPYQFKYLGGLILVPGFVMAYLVVHLNYKPDFLDLPVFAIYSAYLEKTIFGITQTNFADEIALIFILVGLSLIAFSKQKAEKASDMELRGKSLFLAVILNIAFIILATLMVFGMGFLTMLVIHIFSLLIIYLIIFNTMRMINKRNKRL